MDAVKDPMALQPGNYHVEITGSEEKVSKNGNRMWELTLRALDFNCKLCHDRMMIDGGGVNITKAKLSALGLDGKVEPGHLLGKRVYVAVKETPADGQYARKLDVDISVKGTNAGYWKEKPAAVVEPVVTPDSEIPF